MAQVRQQVEPLSEFPSRDYQEGDIILNEGFTTSKTADATLDNSEQNVLVDATGGVVTITLPAPVEGRTFYIKKIDSSANAVTVATVGSGTIDGAATQSLATQWEYIKVISDGTDWFIVSVG